MAGQIPKGFKPRETDETSRHDSPTRRGSARKQGEQMIAMMEETTHLREASGKPSDHEQIEEIKQLLQAREKREASVSESSTQQAGTSTSHDQPHMPKQEERASEHETRRKQENADRLLAEQLRFTDQEPTTIVKPRDNNSRKPDLVNEQEAWMRSIKPGGESVQVRYLNDISLDANVLNDIRTINGRALHGEQAFANSAYRRALEPAKSQWKEYTECLNSIDMWYRYPNMNSTQPALEAYRLLEQKRVDGNLNQLIKTSWEYLTGRY